MDTIYVLDFGSQYSHLITKRIRELGTYSELLPPNTPIEKLRDAKGIVLSGGPQNLSETNALRVDKKIYSLGVPILGICYGMQLTAYELGGKVKAGKHREYGATKVKVDYNTPIFKGLKIEQDTWMSHGDQVTKLPKGFDAIASSENTDIAAMANTDKSIYCLQFHPEVTHTKNGTKILENFLKVCSVKRDWSMQDFISEEVSKIRDTVGKDRVVCALSGGVDSAVAAALVAKAIGKQLYCIYVDTGLMRAGETEQIKNVFSKQKHINLKVVNAEKEFLAKLKNVTDPEKKRKTIGELFIRIFEKEAKKIGGAKWLVQGTLYTDAVSSGVSKGKTAAVIKSHHNVGGLPKKFGFKLIEPLRDLYKYEVRNIGAMLGLPEKLVQRQPFPGPGLAVRVLGEVTKEKLDLLRLADAIVCDEIESSGLNKEISQYFAVLPNVKSVGVQGDFRTYGQMIAIRAFATTDFLTASFSKIPYDLIEKISTRITNEVKGVNRVVYDVTNKPPATLEWE